MTNTITITILQGICAGGGLVVTSILFYFIFGFLFTKEIAYSIIDKGYMAFTCMTTAIAIGTWDVLFVCIWLFYSLGMAFIIKLTNEQKKINENKNYIPTFCIILTIIVIPLWLYTKFFL